MSGSKKIYQFSISKQQQVILDLGKIHDKVICSLAKFNDPQNEVLFTSSWDKSVNKISLRYKKILKRFLHLSIDYIHSIALTPNRKYLFISDNSGSLYQLCTRTQKMIKKYLIVSEFPIYCIKVSSNSEFISIGDKKGNLTQISIRKIICLYKF